MLSPSQERESDLEADNAVALHSAVDAGTASRVADWLDSSCRVVGGVRSACVIALRSEAVVAEWPSGVEVSTLEFLSVGASRARNEREGIALRLGPRDGAEGEGRALVVAAPIAGHELVVAMQLEEQVEDTLREALQRLSVSTRWLSFAERHIVDHSGRIGPLLELVATPLEYADASTSIQSWLAALSTRLGGARVSLGVARRGRLEFVATSTSARVKAETNASRALIAAMQEAFDLRQEVSLDRSVAAASDFPMHEALLSGVETEAVVSIPFYRASTWLGVVSIESAEAPPSEGELEVVRAAVGLTAPTLVAQRRQESNLWRLVAEELRDRIQARITQRRFGRPAVFALVLLILGGIALFPVPYRIASETEIEPAVVRAAAAPFDGFISELVVRAGDVVSEGDTLVTLDDRELRLEKARWSGEVAQLIEQHRQAMAEHEASQVRVVMAQLEQARSQLDLVTARLGKSRILAPVSGVVVTGDLEHKVGAPVERGQTLFEVAPSDRYQVVLDVDERDIADVEVGQAGSAVLKASPGEVHPLRVVKITPLSEAAEGVNAFRVEASFDRDVVGLRPGMKGVSRIDVGSRSLLWILTHDAVDWIRLQLWRWLP